ncbi:MAG: NYN domain-containing protein [Chloroflexi bacterium]|nr:MAG: NYN domain-containing protein [Chloroflexota bacterium]
MASSSHCGSSRRCVPRSSTRSFSSPLWPTSTRRWCPSACSTCGSSSRVERLIVDGYNVIHAWPSLKRLLSEASLEAARDKLVERVGVLGMISGESVTVVFDAHHSYAMANSEETVEGVRVVFTRRGHSADHAIERIAYAASNTGDIITVATSDRFQRDLVRGMGGAVISALELERRVTEAESEMTRRVKRYQ